MKKKLHLFIYFLATFFVALLFISGCGNYDQKGHPQNSPVPTPTGTSTVTPTPQPTTSPTVTPTVTPTIKPPAAWYWQIPKPLGETVTSIWMNSSTDVFFGGWVGNIVHFDGVSFKELYTGTNEDINYLWGTSATDMFAVGTNGLILHYDGTTYAWDHMDSGLQGIVDIGQKVNLNCVYGFAPNDVFAVGDYGTILHYNGTKWENMSGGVVLLGKKVFSKDIVDINPVMFDFYAVWGTSSKDVWVAGDYGVVGHYDGSSWNFYYSGDSMTGLYEDLYRLWGTSSSNVYAVGEYGTIIRFNGTHWEPVAAGVCSNEKPKVAAQPSPSPTATPIWLTDSDLYDIWGFSSSDIYVVGENGFVGHFNGNEWENVSPEVSSARAPKAKDGVDIDIWAVKGLSGSNMFFAGDYGAIAYYNGSTATLLTQYQFFGFIDLFSLSASNTYSCGIEGFIGHYNGSKWTQIYGWPQELIDSKKKTAAEPTPEPTDYPDLTGIWASSTSNIYAVGENGNVIHFNGTTWDTTVLNPDLSGNNEYLFQPLNIHGTSANDIFVVGAIEYNNSQYAKKEKVKVNGPYGNIWHYDGTTWSMMDFPYNTTLLSVYAIAPDDVYAVGAWGDFYGYAKEKPLQGYGGVILHFDGESWEEVMPFNELELISKNDYWPMIYTGVWASSKDNVYVTGTNLFFMATTQEKLGSRAYHEGSLSSIIRFNGERWSVVVNNISGGLFSIWGSAADDIYAVGWNIPYFHNQFPSSMILHFNGKDWSQMFSKTAWFLLKVHGSGPDNVFTCGIEQMLHYPTP